MSRAYGSIDDARRAFDAYASVEARLLPLWELCRRAAPPVREVADDDDDDGVVDPFEDDALASDQPDDDWCAEDSFFAHVKPRVSQLVGSDPPGEPHALHSHEAYETIYAPLIKIGRAHGR